MKFHNFRDGGMGKSLCYGGTDTGELSTCLDWMASVDGRRWLAAKDLSFFLFFSKDPIQTYSRSWKPVEFQGLQVSHLIHKTCPF